MSWLDVTRRVDAEAEVAELRRTQAALRESERHAQILLGELQHRVRNMLAVIRSLALRTSETTETSEEMFAHFQGRLDAFSRVQAALTRSADATVDLTMLIEDELAAFATREGDCVTIEGPDVALSPKTAERLSLAIHELTTNAVKYGALTKDGGRIDVRWTADDGRLALSWIEGGVSMSSDSAREGFGMELLKRSLPYDLQGETDVELTPTGLHFSLNTPLRNGSSDANEGPTD